MSQKKDKYTKRQVALKAFVEGHAPAWVAFVAKKHKKNRAPEDDLDSIPKFYVKYDNEKETLIMMTPDEGRNRFIEIHDIRQIDCWFDIFRPKRQGYEEKK